MSEKRQYIRHTSSTGKDIVFDKSVFLNIFNKDIRRVYIYKKAERLASAVYLITPAFRDSVSLRSKIESVAVTLTDAASLPGTRLHEALSRELLTLSSLLSMARAGGMLSSMNADLIAKEAQSLLAEVTLYEEPRLALAEPAALSTLVRQASIGDTRSHILPVSRLGRGSATGPTASKGQTSLRQVDILSFIKDKGTVSIKDLVAIVRGVSEKTIQRELLLLIESGQVAKQGERRWTTYTLAS